MSPKRLAMLAVVLALGGCTNLSNAYGTLTGTVISPTTVYVAANAFDTAEATVTNYLRLPPCVVAGGPVCRDPRIAAQAVSVIRRGRPIRNQLEALVSAGAGNQPVPASLYNALVAIVTQAQQTVGAPR